MRLYLIDSNLFLWIIPAISCVLGIWLGYIIGNFISKETNIILENIESIFFKNIYSIYNEYSKRLVAGVSSAITTIILGILTNLFCIISLCIKFVSQRIIPHYEVSILKSLSVLFSKENNIKSFCVLFLLIIIAVSIGKIQIESNTNISFASHMEPASSLKNTKEGVVNLQHSRNIPDLINNHIAIVAIVITLLGIGVPIIITQAYGKLYEEAQEELHRLKKERDNLENRAVQEFIKLQRDIREIYNIELFLKKMLQAHHLGISPSLKEFGEKIDQEILGKLKKLQKSPNTSFHISWYCSAYTYCAKGEYAAAFRVFQQIEDLLPDEIDATIGIVLTSYMQGMLFETLKSLKKLISSEYFEKKKCVMKIMVCVWMQMKLPGNAKAILESLIADYNHMNNSDYCDLIIDTATSYIGINDFKKACNLLESGCKKLQGKFGLGAAIDAYALGSRRFIFEPFWPSSDKWDIGARPQLHSIAGSPHLASRVLNMLSLQATALAAKGQYEECLKVYEEAAKEIGENFILESEYSISLFLPQLHLANMDAALKWQKMFLHGNVSEDIILCKFRELIKKLSSANSSITACALDNYGSALARIGQFKEAHDKFKQSSEIARNIWGYYHPDTLRVELKKILTELPHASDSPELLHDMDIELNELRLRCLSGQGITPVSKLIDQAIGMIDSIGTASGKSIFPLTSPRLHWDEKKEKKSAAVIAAFSEGHRSAAAMFMQTGVEAGPILTVLTAALLDCLSIIGWGEQGAYSFNISNAFNENLFAACGKGPGKFFAIRWLSAQNNSADPLITETLTGRLGWLVTHLFSKYDSAALNEGNLSVAIDHIIFMDSDSAMKLHSKWHNKDEEVRKDPVYNAAWDYCRALIEGIVSNRYKNALYILLRATS